MIRPSMSSARMELNEIERQEARSRVAAIERELRVVEDDLMHGVGPKIDKLNRDIAAWKNPDDQARHAIGLAEDRVRVAETSLQEARNELRVKTDALNQAKQQSRIGSAEAAADCQRQLEQLVTEANSLDERIAVYRVAVAHHSRTAAATVTAESRCAGVKEQVDSEIRDIKAGVVAEHERLRTMKTELAALGDPQAKIRDLTNRLREAKNAL